MMETRLNIKKSAIIGGREIDVDFVNTKNQTLHLCALPLSKLLLFLIECDSNNTTRTIVPRDSRIINMQMKAFKEELIFSTTKLDQPMGRYDKVYKILIPTEVELKKFPNAKIERVAMAILNLLNVMMQVDSSGAKTYVDLSDRKDIEKSFNVALAVVAKWIGTGDKVKDKDEWETGYDVPAFIEVGRIVPDSDADAAQVHEPSADIGPLGRPDAPDTKSGD